MQIVALSILPSVRADWSGSTSFQHQGLPVNVPVGRRDTICASARGAVDHSRVGGVVRKEESMTKPVT